MLERLFLLIGLTVSLGLPHGAAEQASLSKSTVDLDTLSQSQTWLKLGRYKSGRFGAELTSDIITESYFLAETGSQDPAAELQATLLALDEPLGDNPDESTLCRFPARALFLQEEMGLSFPDPLAVCPEFREFANDGKIDDVSVLFVGSYLDNPGSAFGHLLLRFHTDSETRVVDVTDVLDRSINYGAADSENDPMIPYVWKGFTGKYQSTFSTLPFFHHSERYREQQLRNVWEYRLDLEQDKVDLMVAHVWELLNVKNRYYFLRQNCAYRIAEIVELGTGQELKSNNKAWVAPMDVFHAMMEAEGGLVSSVKRLASRETIFNESYRALNANGRTFVDAVLSEPDVPLPQHLEVLQIEDPARAMNVLLDRFAYDDRHPGYEQRRKEVLAARYQYPPSQTNDRKDLTPPHAGQKPTLVQVSALQNDELGAGLEFRIRPAYFDFLSNTVGTAPYSELAMGDLRVVLRDDELHLRQLEIVRVTALNAATSEAPGSGRNAWRVRFGLENRDLSCDDCLLGYGEGGFGKGYEVAENMAVYGLATGRLELGDNALSNIQARASTGFVWNGDNAGLHIEGGYLTGVDKSEPAKFTGHAEMRFGSNNQRQWRAKIAHDEATEASFSINLYW